MSEIQLPDVVSHEEWESSIDELLVREKKLTREHDALAAERRRLPMVEISGDYEFEGPDGVVKLVDLFEGRSQLILYHFWHPADGEPCGGCSSFTGHLTKDGLHHLHARDTSFAIVSTAPVPQLETFREHMGWPMPWYSVVGPEFQEMRGTSNYFKLDVYIRDGDRVFLTYQTRSRGVEALGSFWTFLDITPLGRQEQWEDSPPGRPQVPAYTYWKRYDTYSPEELSGEALRDAAELTS